MRTRFRGITVREGVLLAGPAGWGEWSPFLEYDAARSPRPGCAAPRRRPPATGPRRCATGSRQRHRARRRRRARPRDRAAPAGCTTAKVKVAEPGQTLADDEARLEAVRDALGPDGPDPGRRQRRLGRRRGGRARSGRWTGPPAGWSTSSSRARASRSWPPYAGAVDVPIAADESIRRAADPYRVRDLEAADIAVLKVQPLGGVRACLRIAEDIGLPVVVSSALETSVGIAAGVALAAALPELPYACGLATVQLLTDDVVDRRRCCRSTACCRSGCPRRRRGADAARRRPRTGSRTGSARLAEVRGACGRIDARDQPVDRRWPAPSSTRWSTRGVTDVVLAPGSRNAPLSFAAYDAAEAGLLRLHTRIDERTAGFLALGLAKVARAGPRSSARPGTAVANLHPAVLEAAHAGRARWSRSPPTGPARLRGTGANQTTDQVGIFGPLVPRFADARRGRPPDALDGPALAAGGPCHLNVQLDEPLVPGRAAGTPGPPAPAGRATAPCHRPGAEPARCRSGPRTVVVAGDDAGPPARVLAERGRLAAARRADQRVAHRATTRCAATGCCSTASSARGSSGSWSVGHPTLSRPVSRLLARDGRRGRRRCRHRRRLARAAVRRSTAPCTTGRRVDEPDDPAWLDEWRAADAEPRPAARRAARAPSPTSRRTRSPARSAAPYPPSGLLFVGASSPIRDLDLMVARVRRRRPPQGHRQPRPRRHRRHRLDRDRRRARPARTAPARSR